MRVSIGNTAILAILMSAVPGCARSRLTRPIITFARHPAPPGDGLSWYLQKAWDRPLAAQARESYVLYNQAVNSRNSIVAIGRMCSIVLRDDYKGTRETIFAALDVLAEIPARRKIVRSQLDINPQRLHHAPADLVAANVVAGLIEQIGCLAGPLGAGIVLALACQ